MRPGWHRPVGIAVAVLGIALILVNYAEQFGLGLMPGGHKEAYFILGVVMGAVGAWFLAAFDRPG